MLVVRQACGLDDSARPETTTIGGYALASLFALVRPWLNARTQHARKGNRGRTVLEAVADMSGPGQGVETLVVVLGSNNALGAVVSLEPAWTPEGYDALPLDQRLAARVGCNLWRPSAFAADWSALEAMVRGSGVFGDKVDVPADASAKDKLLGLLGRTP